MLDFRSTCVVQAVSALLAGAVLLVAPGVLLGLFGLAGPASTELLGRMFGGVLIALGATLIAARDLADPVARRWLLVGNAVCDAAITGFLALAVSGGLTGPIGWVLVALFAINAISWVALIPRG
jgi:hypothetical protein